MNELSERLYAEAKKHPDVPGLPELLQEAADRLEHHESGTIVVEEGQFPAVKKAIGEVPDDADRNQAADHVRAALKEDRQ